MTKQMISFTDPQRKFLQREAKLLGISRAEVVRRALDYYIGMLTREGKIEREVSRASTHGGGTAARVVVIARKTGEQK